MIVFVVVAVVVVVVVAVVVAAVVAVVVVVVVVVVDRFCVFSRRSVRLHHSCPGVWDQTLYTGQLLWLLLVVGYYGLFVVVGYLCVGGCCCRCCFC